MILYFVNRSFDVLGLASTKLDNGYEIIDDELTEDIESGIAGLTAKIAWNDDNRLQLEEWMGAGNYVLTEHENEPELFTILTSETDTAERSVTIYAEGAGLDLINERAPAYKADAAHTVEWYINHFIGDADFEIGTNEIPDKTRKLSWDGDSTVTERIRSIATQFDNAEISFSFEVENLKVTHKYINIWVKRGTDASQELRLDRDIDSFRVITSVEDLITGLVATGGTPEGSGGPITLKNYSYDDGDLYVDASGNLLSRTGAAEWGRMTKGSDLSFIMGTFSYETTSQSELCTRAVSYLNEHKDPAVNYEVNIVHGLDNARIGDRVNLVDDKGEIYVSARILELKTSETQGKKEAVLGEYLIKSSGISDIVLQLAGQFQQLAQARALYTWLAYADDQYGTNITTDPTGKAYIGTAVHRTTPDVDISDPSIFMWTKFAGTDGSSVVDVKLFYKKSETTPEKPTQSTEGKTLEEIINTVPTGWNESEPEFDISDPTSNLYKTVRIVYSDGTVQYNRVTIDASFNSVKAVIGNFDTLVAGTATVGALQADTAKIHSLTANELSAATAYITALQAGSIAASDIIADHAAIGAMDATYAHIDLANVNNAWIENGLIKNGAISDAQILDVSANKLTTGTIDAGRINVINLNASNLTVGTINGQRIGSGSIDLDKLSEEVPTKDYLDSVQQALQEQIDGALNTFTGIDIPTLDNYPAVEWTDKATKENHVGDIYYIVDEGSDYNGWCYRFMRTPSYGGSIFRFPNGKELRFPDGDRLALFMDDQAYKWVLVQDSDITKALADIVVLQGDVSGLKDFQTDTASWITDTDDELSSIKGRTSSLETNMGNKVDITTFNELSQTVDENSASIRSLQTTVSNKADGSTVETISNTVNTISQKADSNEAAISSLTQTVSTKADGSTVETLSSTVNTISQTASGNSSKIENLTVTLGTNADGTSKAGDIVHKMSSVEQDLDGFKTTVSQTYHKTSDFNTFKTENDADIADAKKAGTDAQSDLNSYKMSNDSAVAAVQNDLDSYKDTVEETYATQSSVTQTANSIRQDVESTYTKNTTFNAYKDSNDQAVAAAKKAGDDAQDDLDAYKTTVSETYASKSSLTQTANSIKSEVSEAYATKTSVPTKVSQLTNDSDYATKTEAEGYADTAESNAIADTTEKLKSYSTTQQMNSAIEQSANGIRQTVSETYATKTSVPTKVSQLTNDSSYATTTQAQGYADDAEGNAKADTTEKLKSYYTKTQTDSAIDQKADTISLAVSQTYETKTDAGDKLNEAKSYTGTEISSAKAEIKVTTDGISSEVSRKVGNDEVISRINQSAESVKISASKVDIEGAAIFSQYASKSDLEDTKSDIDDKLSALEDDISDVKDNLDLRIVYDWGTTSVTLTALLMQNGVDIHEEYPASLYGWQKETQNVLTSLGTGYTKVIPRADLNYVSAVTVSLTTGVPLEFRFNDSTGLRMPDGRKLAITV